MRRYNKLELTPEMAGRFPWHFARMAIWLVLAWGIGRAEVIDAPARGDIVDRNGVVLATTIEVPSVYANPHRIVDTGGAAAAIAEHVDGLDVAATRLALQRNSRFVWIAHNISADQMHSVAALGIPGIGVKFERLRRYPRGPLASHVVGFTDESATVGQAGIELSCDAELKRGFPERLTLDSRIQDVVRTELSRAMLDYGASGAGGILLDVNTMQILALVSLPDYEPGIRASITPYGLKNIITSNVYEVGGMFEIFTVAAALEAHEVEPETRVRVTPTLRIGAHTVRDENPVDKSLSVTEIFERSSLVGAARIAELSTPEAQRAALRSMGLLDAMRIELVESVGSPLVPINAWGPYVRTTIGYGYGIALSPLQAAATATAIVHRGVLLKPSLLMRAEYAAPSGRVIVSETTASKMRALLRSVVVHGTGRNADVPGFAVGGKTGTTLEQTAGRYDPTRRRTWFFAGWPMVDAPRFTLLVMLDGPQRNLAPERSATAEWNAAPTSGRIIARVGSLLGVAP